MKIGILTLMHGYNYGGLLQCYALQETLKSKGHSVEVIDFNPNPQWRRIRRLSGSFGRKIGGTIVDAICSKKYGLEVHKRVGSFRQKYLQMSKSCNTRESLISLASKLDAIIVGSDQVWNFAWHTPEYFFDFAQELPVRKFSYAACFGNSPQDNFNKSSQVGSWLRKFDAISVRNDMSQKLVKTISGRDSEIVSDPTLLTDFKLLSELPDLVSGKYMLLYGLSKSRLDRMAPEINRIKKHYGLPIVAVKSDVLQPWPIEIADHIIHNPKVEEWVGLFQNASFVLTDSFHGTLFALKNKVPFLNYICGDASSARLAFIKDKYQIDDGIPSSLEELKKSKGYCGDFIEPHRLLAQHIDYSHCFIKKAGL